MTQGNCIFNPRCGFQVNLEGHYNTVHNMPMPQAPITSVPQQLPAPQFSAPQPKHLDTAYCPTCGQKQKAQTWRESFVAWIRYGIVAFWVGAFLGTFAGFQWAATVFHP